MTKIKVPSLQHLARNWGSDPAKVQKTLVNLVKNPPIFTYNPLFGAVRDMLIFGQPYNQIVEGIKRGVKQESVRKNFLEVLPLIRDHFDGIAPTFVQAVGQRNYPIAQGLVIPFTPPLVYGVGGQIIFPWFSFWRTNPLADKRLSLFVSIVEEILSQDPDLDGAAFQILDFSVPASDQPRRLHVYDAKHIIRLPKDEIKAMLAVFADGYFRAEAELAQMPKKKKDESPHPDDHQSDLFK